MSAPMLAGRIGLSPVMIGRRRALAQLRRAAAQPGFVLALISGEAGVGKTRLLRELAAATPRPMFAGQADPSDAAHPFAIVNELLGASGPSGSGPVSSAADALDAILALIGRQGAILAFEDLHWADAGSVEAFERLAQLRSPGLLLIGTYRTEDLSRRLPGGDMLARLERRHDVERIHLDRLDRAEVAAFLATVYGRPLPSAVTAAMYERTGGNPFFLEELVSAQRDVAPDELAAQPLPWSLEEVVRGQLDGLSAPERRLAEAAAILGSSASFDVLAAVAELGEDELLTRLRSLVDSGLLIEQSDDHFVFRHALVRDAVASHLLGRERRRLHERALRLLSTEPGTTHAELAHHAAGAGRYEELVAHARAGAAAELRQRGSSHLALRLASEALAEEPDDVTLLDVATEAAWLLGLHAEALTHAEHLLIVGERDGSLAAQASALRWLVRVHHDNGDESRSVAFLDRLVALLDEPLEEIDRVRTLAAIAQTRMLRGESAEALVWADRAIAEATAAGAEEVRAQAMVERGSAAVWLDRANRAELEAAIAEAQRLGLWVLVTRGLNNLFDAVPVHSAEGQDLLARFRDAAERAGFDAMTTIVWLVRRIELGFGLGDAAIVDDALARSQEWLTLQRHRETEWLEARRVQFTLEQGRPVSEEVIAALDASHGSVPDGHRAWIAHIALAAAAVRGDRDDVRGRLTDIANLPAVRDPNTLVDSLDAALRVGVDAGEAYDALTRAGAVGAAQATATLLEAVVAHHIHDHARAVEMLVAELADPDPWLGAPVIGHLWTLAGFSALSLGRRETARHAAGEAGRHLAAWTGWRTDQLTELDARLDATRAPTEPGELTGREQEVADLVAEGLSNGEIAKRLFISPKTASVHVSNILAKLRLSNRTEIAAWVLQRRAD